MASQKAICMKCGDFKDYALDRCARCGLEPVTATEKARSFILSEVFDVGEDVFGRTIPELRAISTEIESGQPFTFDAAEVLQVQSSFAEAESITTRELVTSGIKWLFVPGIIGLLAILSFFYD